MEVMLGIPKRMDVIDGAGEQVAHLHSPPFTVIKDKVNVAFASGEELQLQGTIIENDYAVRDSHGNLRIHITQKWVTVRDRDTVDVADGQRPEVAFALAWAIDRWVERD
ncbi:hypothetical protein [Demequina aestuarii]|uniref:hypothetical protein n=1 Tax=Demequina aestuarii TaxID=327095 RepID=UPI00128D8EC6|nr:hypothetical protein [Demequina aestuarii]